MRFSNIRFAPVLLFLILSLGACNTRKKVTTEPSVERNNAQAIWNALKQTNFDFDWYHATAKSQVSFEGMTIGGKADIRIRRDSAILISVTKFGFELARTLIRPDSVFAINRLERSYISSSFDAIRLEYNLPFTFGEFQEIIAGNQLFEGQVPISGLSTGDGYILKTTGKGLFIVYTLDHEKRIKAGKYTDEQGRSFEYVVKEHSTFDKGILMPAIRSYYYPSEPDPEYMLLFELEKAEIDQPLKMKFDIPSGYAKM